MSMLFPRGVVEAVGEWDTSLRQCQDGDFVLRSLEHAPVRGEQEVATFYRRHGQAQSANLARALEYESLVVDRYLERHPEQAGTRLEREARANLLVVKARAATSLGKGGASSFVWWLARSRSIRAERAGPLTPVSAAICQRLCL
jgi:hypothetical protein